MWHVSVAGSPEGGRARWAETALRGVGDSTRGEWVEITESAYHLRRRLSAGEEARVGPAVDIRGTREQIDRWLAVRAAVPRQILPLLAEPL